MDVWLDALGLDLTTALESYSDTNREELDQDITERLTHKVDKLTGVTTFDRAYIKTANAQINHIQIFQLPQMQTH